MRKVLLTGASGFIGRQCLPFLHERGFSVHAVSRHAPADHDPASGTTWHATDLRDPDAVARLLEEVAPTHLLHFAWIATPGVYWTSLENLDWVRASLDLLKRFEQHGGQRVVMAGTCAEYEWGSGVFHETRSPLVPATTYGQSKNHLRGLLETFARRTETSAAWGRIFFVHGPHEPHARLVASVARALLRGQNVACTHGRQVRDFLHAEDVASAFVALLDSDVTGAVNIGSGRGVTLGEVIHGLADRLDARALVQLGARECPADEVATLVADVGRLTHEVGWKPAFTLDEALDRTLASWQDELAREQAPCD
ncbi:MAG: NAD(P)-dependent oxidoreductase [Acidobacteriota bacterium]